MMEAVWTRFFPLAREVQDFIAAGKLGDVKRMYADFSFWNDVEKEFGKEHRMVNRDLAGGALLDLGIYSLTWVFMILYHSPQATSPGALDGEEEEKEEGKKDPRFPVISSAVSLYPPTGADESTTVLLHFPSGAHALASTSIIVGTHPSPDHPSPDAIRIQGTLGDLSVNYAPRPRTYTLLPASSASRGKLAEWEYEVVTRHEEIPGGGHGMFWEADECARCVRDKKLESTVMPLGESEAVLRVMDEVRRQGGVVYSEEIEGLEYDAQSVC